MKLPIHILLPKSFFDEEWVCDYKVDATMKKVWAVQLDLLNEFASVCRKHEIEFIVFGGTMLGAVRHRGFIPWDDDIDVALSRENYEKLVAISGEAFHKPYFLQTCLNDRKCFISDARLRNSDTTAIINGQHESGYNNGIFIDVFALDGIVDDGIRAWIQQFEKHILGSALNLYYSNIESEPLFKRIVKKCIRPFVRVINYETIYGLYKKVLCRYNGSSSRIGLVAHNDWFRSRYWVYSSELKQTINIPFCNLYVPVPKDWDGVLRRTYGEYMKYPPAETRGLWHKGKIFFDPERPFATYFR